MRYINLITVIYTLGIILNNFANSANITLNLACDMLEKPSNKDNKTNIYKHKIICKDGNNKQKYFFFNDFDSKDTKIINELATRYNGNFILTGLDSYPISTEGNFTINGEKYNLQKEFGLPNSASNLFIIIRGLFISANVRNIFINGNKILKPILFIDYDGFDLRDITIKCSNIPFIKLEFNTNNEGVNYCEVNNIESIRRYTVFQSNIETKIGEVIYIKNKKLVIQGKKITPYNKMFWDLV